MTKNTANTYSPELLFGGHSVESRQAAIETARSKADRYGHLGIILAARELLARFDGEKFPRGTGKAVSELTGYQASEVSRWSAALVADVNLRYSLATLNVDSLIADVNGGDNYKVESLRALGVAISNRPDRAAGARKPKSESATEEVGTPKVTANRAGTVKEESRDIPAEVYDWLLGTANDEQFANRIALLENVLEQVKMIRAGEIEVEEVEEPEYV